MKGLLTDYNHVYGLLESQYLVQSTKKPIINEVAILKLIHVTINLERDQKYLHLIRGDTSNT